MQDNATVALTFEEIYRLYGERILNLAYRFTHGEEVARDLTQEVFIKVHQNLSSFREDAQIYTWIHRIAVNHILNYLKQERRSGWLKIMDEEIGEVIQTADTESVGLTAPATPAEVLEQTEREKIVWNAVESLGIKYRVPFILFRYEEMSYREIADTLNLSLSAVEARIHRAKKHLIRKLEPWLEHL